MITEDYCSPEVAKLLDKKGFREYCEAIYFILENGDYRWSKIDIPIRDCSTCKPTAILCPTHQMAMKFLRKKDVIIVIQPEYFNAESKCSAWGCDIWVNDNYKKVQGDFPSFEEAVNAALKYSLENLI